MTLMQKVAHNTALQLIGKILGTVLGFAATVIVLRYLGDEKYGNYTTALVYLQLFGILMDLGLYIVLLKHVSSAENDDLALQNNIFTARAVTAIIFLLAAIVLVWFIPSYPTIVKWSVIVAAANFFFITMNQLLMAMYQKYFSMGRVAIAETTSKVVLLLLTILVVYVFHAGLLAIMLTITLGGAVYFGILWFGLRKYTTIRWAMDMVVWKRLFKESWPVALSIGLNLIYFKADTIILGLFRSQAEVGIYGAPYKILEVIITLPAMIVGLVMPVLSKSFAEKNLEEFRYIYQRTFDALCIVAVPLIVGTFLVAHRVMEIVAGKDFTANQSDLGTLLQILMLAVGIIFIGTLTGYLVVIINKQITMVWSYGFVALTALIGYLYFIPRYSYFGAAGMTVYSETAIMLCGVIIIYRATKIVPSLKTFWRIVAASLVMGLAIWLIQSWNIILVIAIALVIYPLLLFVFGIMTKENARSFLNLRSHS